MNSCASNKSPGVGSFACAAGGATTVEELKAIPLRKSNKMCGHDVCKRKLALTDFACRCGIRFCGEHRYAEDHACTFEYKSLAAKVEGCAAEKMEKV